MALDRSRALTEQGPYDVILHKVDLLRLVPLKTVFFLSLRSAVIALLVIINEFSSIFYSRKSLYFLSLPFFSR